ncbi:glucose-methanol-choline oxidoreductase [Apiospora arundinis]
MKCSLALIASILSLAAASPIGGLPGLPVDSVLNEVGKQAGPVLGEVEGQLGSALDKANKTPSKPVAAPAVPAPAAVSSPLRSVTPSVAASPVPPKSGSK